MIKENNIVSYDLYISHVMKTICIMPNRREKKKSYDKFAKSTFSICKYYSMRKHY